MNTIKISGKIVKKETIKNNKSLLKLVLAMPLHMKAYDPEKGTPRRITFPVYSSFATIGGFPNGKKRLETPAYDQGKA